MSFSLKNKSARGYTLIELAIVIAVAGIVLASGASAYKLYLKNQEISTTVNNTSLVVNAISNFMIQQGRYPCPARLNAKRTDYDYGMETDCTDVSVAPGNCSNGICVEKKKTDATVRVRRGGVPFRQLSLPEPYSEDGYHMRIAYAVTEKLTNALTYDVNGGGISIEDDQTPARSIVNPPDSAHFLVLSAGADKLGAYTHEGQPYLPCGTGLDSANCDTSPANPDAVYRFAKTSTTGGASNYDDYLKFYTSVDAQLWKVADPGGLDIRDLVNAGAPGGGKIGVGNGVPGQTLDVNGNIQVTGNAQVSQLCDNNQTPSPGGCFPPDRIGGTTPEMDCTNPAHPGYDVTKPYVTGIQGGAVVCSALPTVGCAAGQKMTGVAADGTLICGSFTGCPAGSVNVCKDQTTGIWDTRPVPVGVTGQNFSTSPVSGISRVNSYQCNNGSWGLTGKTGICSCTNSTNTSTMSCNDFMGTGNWTGNATVTTTRVCPAPPTTTTVSSACVCAAATQTTTDSCPSGQAGSITSKQAWVCDSPTAGHYNAPVVTSNTCACAPQTQTQTKACPSSAYTGGIQQKNVFQCPAGTWTGWTDVPGGNTCVCGPGGTVQNQPAGCPAGQVGQVQQTRTYNCATDTWSAWANIPGTSTCSPVTYSWKPQSAATSSSVRIGNQVDSPCPTQNDTGSCYSAAAGGGYLNYPSCTCQ